MRAQQRGELALAVSARAAADVPGVHGLTEQRDLAHAAGDQRGDLGHDVVRRAVALGAARVRHDAERAALVAALHHRDEAVDLARAACAAAP